MDGQQQQTSMPVNPVYMPNGVLNFFISLIPGAGQMYQGMLQRGVTLMACFAMFIALASFFGNMLYGLRGLEALLIGISVTGVVITYFYSFFDSMRTCRAIRAGVEMKDYLGLLDQPFTFKAPKVTGNGRVILGVLFIIIGTLSMASYVINNYTSEFFRVHYLTPALNVLFPAVLLIAGVILLIRGCRARKDAA